MAKTNQRDRRRVVPNLDHGDAGSGFRKRIQFAVLHGQQAIPSQQQSQGQSTGAFANRNPALRYRSSMRTDQGEDTSRRY